MADPIQPHADRPASPDAVDAPMRTALRERDERLRLILQSVRDYAIFAIDPAGVVLDWNSGAEAVFGWPEPEIVGRSADVLWTPEDRANGVPQGERDTALAKGRAEDERWHQRKDGSRFYASGVLVPLYDEARRLRGYTKVCRDRTQARLATQALQRADEVAERSRVQMEMVVAGANVGVWYCTLPFDHLDWDAKTKEHFHLPPDAPVTIDTFYERIHSDDRERTRAAIDESVRLRRPYNIDYRTVSVDGTQVKWIRAIGRAYYDAGGNPIRFDGITVDVTARNLAELERLASEEQLQLALAVSQLGTFVIDLRTDAVTVNDRGREIYGWAMGEPLTFAKVQSHFHPDDRDRVVATVGAAFDPAGRGEFEVEQRIVRTDGAVRWIRVRGRAIFETVNRHLLAVRCLGTYLDITESKLAETALRESESRFRFLSDLGEATRALVDPEQVMATVAQRLGVHLRTSRCAYAEVDADEDRFRIQYDYVDGVPSTVGDYNLSLFGSRAAADQRAGRTLVVHDVDAELAVDDGAAMFNAIGIKALICCPLIRGGRLVAMMAVHQSQPRRWSLAEVSLVEAVVERSWAYIERARVARALAESEANHRQLAESERAARAEAERTSRMKDDFLATLSHELRTPLNAIVGWAQILRSGNTTSSEDLQEGLETIDRNARAQTQIIEDLLDMSRIISGKIRLDVQRVDLAAIVQEAIDTVRPAAVAKGIVLHAVVDPVGVPITGDPSRLQQVFWNLLSNAIKFTPKGGRVQVVLRRVNSHLEVNVTDTGEGIRPDFLPFVFDRFRQADATTTRRHGGLGLGLSIVKQLVDLHGGVVTARSPGAGQGSTFTVQLPLTVFHPDPALEDEHPRAPVTLKDQNEACVSLDGVRVLAVDDEPDARAVVQRLLTDCGAVVATAGNVAEARQRLIAERFDVLVSDIGMPVEDGYALIRWLRAQPADRGGTMPAVALTAYARTVDRVKALRAGYQMHAVKPIEPAELLLIVASLVGRK